MTRVVGSVPPQVAEALARLDDLVRMFEQHPDAAVQEAVLEMLRAVDAIHRPALEHLRGFLATRNMLDDAVTDPHAALLFDLYDDQRDDEWSRAEAAIEKVRPYVESYGGRLEVVAADDGVVNIRLLGGCDNCSGSTARLRGLVEQALHAELPGFVRLNVSQPAARAGAGPLIPLSSLRRRSGLHGDTTEPTPEEIRSPSHDCPSCR